MLIINISASEVVYPQTLRGVTVCVVQCHEWVACLHRCSQGCAH